MSEAEFERTYPLVLRSAQIWSAAAVVNGTVLLADREDIEQELLTCVWQALSKYDAARAGLRTFIELVVRTQFTSMFRARWRRSNFESLDDRNIPISVGFHAMELRTDARRVLADVSVFDRAVAFYLTECSAVETSRELGVSRAAVYRAIGRLRVAFTAAGFTDARQYAAHPSHRGVQQQEPVVGITEDCCLRRRVRA